MLTQCQYFYLPHAVNVDLIETNHIRPRYQSNHFCIYDPKRISLEVVSEYDSNAIVLYIAASSTSNKVTSIISYNCFSQLKLKHVFMG